MARYAAKKAAPAPIASGLFQLPFPEFMVRASPRLQRPDHLPNIVEFFERVDAGEVVREGLHAPVQHGKTSTAQHGVAWLMGRHPDWPIIYATYGQNFSAANSREIRRIYTDCGGALQDDFNTIQEWRTGSGGFLLATSPDGTATGKPARVFIIDDPFKNREEAESPDERRKKIDWFRSVALSRQGPKTSYGIIASRYHEEDLTGYVTGERGKGGGLGWPYRRLAAINDDGSDPSRALGAALCPYGPDPEQPRDLAFLESVRADVGEYEWESLYQGRPRPPSGSIFQNAHYIDALPLPSEIQAWAWGVDLAYSESRSSDWTVLVLLALLKDGRVVVADVIKWQKALIDGEPLFRASFAKQPTALAASYISHREMGDVESLMRADPPIMIIPLPARYGKAFRALPTAKAWNAGRILVLRGQTWTSEFVARIVGFDGKEGGKDDEADALVSGVDLLLGTGQATMSKFTFGARRW